MRAHLEAARKAYQELGLSGEGAAQSAITQFGRPAAVARKSVAAWRRGVLRDGGRVGGTAACVIGLSLLLTQALDSVPLELLFMRLGDRGTVSVWVIMHYVVYALAGGVVGLVFPRRAVAGAALGTTAWLIVVLGPILVGTRWVYEPAVWVRDDTAFALLAVAGAWAASRRRGRAERRARG
jgi:hypothetical protein